MLRKISSFPINLLCLFSPCIVTVALLQLANQIPTHCAQASCSLHAWVSRPPGPPGTAPLLLISHFSFLPLSPGTTSELQEGLKLSFSWQIVNIVPYTLLSVPVCHPQSQPSLHFHGVQGPGGHETPTRGTQMTLPLESPREGKASSILLGTMRTATTPPQSPPKRLSHWFSPF